MNKMSSVITTLLIIFSVLCTEKVVAGSKEQKECKKPRFSKFDPPKFAEVAPGSKFSFIISAVADRRSIEATVKGIKVEGLKVTDHKSFITAEGTLPPELKDTYARISLVAWTNMFGVSCRKRDGWLVKILGDATTTGSAAEDEEATADAGKSTDVDQKTETKPVATAENPNVEQKPSEAEAAEQDTNTGSNRLQKLEPAADASDSEPVAGAEAAMSGQGSIDAEPVQKQQ